MQPAAGNRVLLVGEGMGTASCPVQKGQKNSEGGPRQCFQEGLCRSWLGGAGGKGMNGWADGQADRQRCPHGFSTAQEVVP